ncbi:MAG: hypothetical protein AB7S26_38490 [Sandaracinaceae bacterium]
MAPTTANFVVERRVGRVVEARVHQLLTREDADRYGVAVLERARGPRDPVLCADHRYASVYPPPAADRLIELFRPNNSVFQRIAIVVSPTNATLLMQLRRLATEARWEHRRVFREADEAATFLSHVLDADETRRMREFLAARPSRAVDP